MSPQPFLKDRIIQRERRPGLPAQRQLAVSLALCLPIRHSEHVSHILTAVLDRHAALETQPLIDVENRAYLLLELDVREKLAERRRVLEGLSGALRTVVAKMSAMGFYALTRPAELTDRAASRGRNRR